MTMVLEVAHLTVFDGKQREFEAAMRQAAPYIMASEGYLGHEVKQCVEDGTKYLLLVQWRTLDDHMVGFRNSDRLAPWRAILTPFYAAPALVEHYETRLTFTPGSV
ncbi:MAG: antibiotic biosynthesis monooxygenase [Anaerolineae bacterium]